MIRRPPSATPTATLLPYTTRFRSCVRPPAGPGLGLYRQGRELGILGRRRRGTHLRHAEEPGGASRRAARSEEHTSELQSLMRISYAVFCLKNKNPKYNE